MKSKAKGFFAIALFVLAVAFPMMADGAEISVDSVDAVAGTSFEVAIRMTGNTNTISALTVPLKFSNSELTVDSVSFANSILPGSFRGVADINNTDDFVRISYIPDQFVNPLPTIIDVSGLIATIHFTLQSGAMVGTTTIDSMYEDTAISFAGNTIHQWTRVEFSDQSGTVSYLPSFDPGAIVVQVATDVDDDNNDLLPTDFGLAQNYPNPFNPSTMIEYTLPRAGFVSLKVYNVIGQEVATLVEGHMSAGVHRVNFDGSTQPSGVYFYKMFHEDGAETRKMMMVK